MPFQRIGGAAMRAVDQLPRHRKTVILDRLHLEIGRIANASK